MTSAQTLGVSGLPPPIGVVFRRKVGGLENGNPARDLGVRSIELTPGERAAFAQRLLACLDEDAEIEDARAVENERRIAGVESGAVQVIPIAEALARVRAALK